MLGKLSAVTATLLTFESEIPISVPNDVRMYTKNALPTVFSSNSKANRMIMEFVLITK